MKLPRQIFATLLTIPLLLTPVYSLADNHKTETTKKKKTHLPSTMKHLLKGIELTQEQSQKIMALHKKQHQDYKKDLNERRKKAREKQAKMNALILADKFDQAAATTLANEMAEEQAKKRINHMRHQHEIFSLLTAEQKKQVQVNMNKHREKSKNKNKLKNKDKAKDKDKGKSKAQKQTKE